MTMDWFKSWNGAPTDPKWLLIAKRSETFPGVVSAIVWALLDYASQNSAERGNVEGFDAETYAAFSGFEETIVRRVVEVLKEKNVIVDGHLANWEKRQSRPQKLSTPRVHKHRNAMKQNETRETPETHREDKSRIEKKKEPAIAAPDLEVDLFRRGKEVLGKTAGGLIKQLLDAKDGKINLARAAIETAAGKENPREYIGGVIRNHDPPPGESSRHVDGRL